MAIACVDLATSKQDLLDMAHECGFSDPEQFAENTWAFLQEVRKAEFLPGGGREQLRALGVVRHGGRNLLED